MQPTLIISTGHPGSGKTSIAKRLSKQYHTAFVSKDALKERIFDALGSDDKTWSLKVSGASHRIMDDVVGQILQSGNSVIVESNFKPEIDSERFTAITEKYNAKCVQILCFADGNTLFERWNERIQNEERHEGHVEEISLEQIRQDLSAPYHPLNLSGELIQLNTSNFSKLLLPKLNV
jgi:predicted kinase